jgi:RNA polymerase sigma-70 factor (ECF subfamily)
MRQLRDPEQVALLPLVEGEVRRALDTLPPDFRLAVILCDVEEFSYEEIARIMGCPLGTVMSRLHRGRKLLQRALYNHAVSMGIVKDAEGTARGAHERPDPSRGACERPDPSRAACERPEKKTNAEPADLAAYRQKKRGVA